MMSEKQRKKRYRLAWKKACILPVFLIIITGTTLTVHAYLKWSTVVENKFTAETSASPTVKENFDNKSKTKVTVNPGETEYSVYVRAAIVATWENSEGEVHANVPVPGVDYELDLNVDTDTDTSKEWFEKDDFYYHKKAVKSSDETAVLINSCKPLKKAPLDKDNPENIYTLKVKIVTQTIQSAGMTDGDETTTPVPAVTSAWSVVVDVNNELQRN